MLILNGEKIFTKLTKTLIIFFYILCSASITTYAETRAQKTLSEDPVVAVAEKFLNSVRTLQGSFVQSSSNGETANGTLYIDRPGLLRIDYQSPTTLQIYSDGTWIFYIDRELKDISQMPLKATPASFLTQDKINFSNEFSIRKIERKSRSLQIQLQTRNTDNAGFLTLLFNKAANVLHGWSITDAQGIRTTVRLLEPIVNKPIAKEIFIFTQPDWAFPTSDND